MEAGPCRPAIGGDADPPSQASTMGKSSFHLAPSAEILFWPLHATFNAASPSASRNPVSRCLISRSASAMIRSISSLTVGMS